MNTTVEISKCTTPATSRRSQPLLVRLERRGLVDLALLGLALLQWFSLTHFHLLDLHRIASSFPSAEAFLPLISTIILTWTLLALGALAPLIRRTPARSPGELPPEAGLWLAAYGLMFLIWLLILFNVNPESLWGFWHLVRLDPDESILLTVLLPLTLAPGWRRLARAGRRAWLRSRRVGRTGPAIPLKTALGRLAPVLALALYALALSDHAIMSDGWGIVSYAAKPQALVIGIYRDAGAILFFQQAHCLLKHVGLNVAQSVSLTNFALALATLSLLGWLMRLMGLSSRQRGLGWWLTISSLGIMQMALGHVEVYTLVQFGLVATLTLGAAALRGRWSPAWMMLAYSLVLAAHLSLIFILPAVLLSLGFWARQQVVLGRLSGRQAALRALAHLLGWGALIHLSMWGWLMLQLPEPTPGGLVRAVLASLNTGGGPGPFVNSGERTLAGRLGHLFHPVNDFKMIQLFFYLTGAAFLTALLIPLAGRLGMRRAPHRRSPAGRQQMAIFATAWLGYTLYALTWQANWAWVEDWDLFSGLAPLTVLLVMCWLMPARREYRLPPALVRRLCLFALGLTLTQHYFLHTRASYLSPMNKVVLDRKDGLAIQRYQFLNGWVRGNRYRVVNGRVEVKRRSSGE